MATCEHTPVVRWTPRRINAALWCPKPTGAIARFYAAGTPPRPTRKPLTAAIAAFIARHADFLTVPSDAAFENRWELPGKPCGWLLVPATTWLVDALATLHAEQDDLEPDNDAEPGADQEPNADEEDTADEEHSDARPTSMDRSGFPDSGPHLVITTEQRRRYRESDCISRAQEMRRLQRWLALR